MDDADAQPGDASYMTAAPCMVTPSIVAPGGSFVVRASGLRRSASTIVYVTDPTGTQSRGATASATGELSLSFTAGAQPGSGLVRVNLAGNREREATRCAFAVAAPCGDGSCTGDETCSSCQDDCGVCTDAAPCGDGSCSGDETCSSCQDDCGVCPGAAPCGDGSCTGDETCSSCPNDCGACASGKPVPGQIEAEDFDNGGEGVAYHDTTTGNTLAAYRNTDVDVGTCSEGGYRVGYIFPGEWLRYTIQVAATGSYTLEIRYATDADAQIHVEVDGAPAGGAIALSSTGSWFTWASVTTRLSLTAGVHAFKVVDDAGNLDWNYLKLTAADACVPESDASLCAGKCGSVVVTDSCRNQRSLNCGACTTGPVSASPSSMAMGEVFVGQARSWPVLLTNTAASSVTINSIAVSGAGFSYAVEATSAASRALPITLSPNQVTWIAVTFKPAQAGAASGTVSVSTSAGTTNVPVSASGKDLVDFADVTTYGARGDGATDDTQAFRTAAATGKILKVPPPPGGQHYKLSGAVRITGPGVVGVGATKPYVKMYGANGLGYRSADGFGHVMFAMDDYAGTVPAVFTGLHLDGGWDGVSNVSEWDHNIMLRGSKNVTVENNLLENPMGDCVLVGGGSKPRSSNIMISNNVCKNPWRCTVAFTSTDGGKAVNNVLLKPNGHIAGAYYHFNVDLEPDYNEWGDQVFNVEVAFNRIDSHMYPGHSGADVGTGVVIARAPTNGSYPYVPAGGNIAVHDNTGSVGSSGLFFQPWGWCSQAQCGADWSNVTAYRNANPLGCYSPHANCP